MKKFHWGWGIAVFYSAFVVFMLTLVFKSTRINEELVTKDYYQQELAYQGQIDKIKRTNALAAPLTWQVKSREVTLSFPKVVRGKQLKADVLFYRPSNSADDFTVQIQPDTAGNCAIRSDRFQPGMYRMQIDWSADGATYYNEGVIHIN